MTRRERGRPDPAAGSALQLVTESVVLGDVIQIRDVGGNISVQLTRPAYRVMDFPARPAALTVEQARAQPSRLLVARYEVVPFAGRAGLLAELSGWLREDGAASVRLIHGPGGQGKSRLAAQLARGHAAAWAVWQARQASPASRDPAPLKMPGDVAGVLMVVDYADQWAPSHLQALITDVHTLAGRWPGAMPLRVLLLARAAGFWWDALEQLLDVDYGIPATAQGLSPLGGEVERGELFAAARDQFAVTLGVGDAGRAASAVPPAGLDEPAFGPVLTVHMAALAAVEAGRRGEQAPADPARISAYLLKRERAHWQQWHARADHPLPTPPEVMSRAAYTGTLTGPLSHAQGIQALTRAQIASAAEAASQILTDHAKCYPPQDAANVLEPLYPDRLGEDLIALTTPVQQAGAAPGDLAAFADPWAVTAVPALLTPALDEQPAAWLAPAMTRLIETARRWPHVATGLLYPLVRAQPRLVLQAGGAAIAALAALPDVDIAVLEAVEACRPPHRHVDLDTGIAALVDRLIAHHLAVSDNLVVHAGLQDTLGLLLSNAGLYQQARKATSKAVRIWRLLAEHDRGAYLPGLAASLNNHVLRLAEAGRRNEAVPVAEEAVQLSRELVQLDRDRHLDDLAAALNNYALRLSDVGRWSEAVAVSEEAIQLARELAGLSPETYLPRLAASLSNHVARLVEMGRDSEAVLASREAVDLTRKVAEGNPDAYLPDLATALNIQASALYTTGQTDEGILVTQQAVELSRELAGHNRDAHLTGLARALITQALFLAEAGRPDEAVMASAEAVQLHRELASRDRAAHLPGLVRSIHGHAYLLKRTGRRDEAALFGEEAAGLGRELAEHDRGDLLIPAAALTAHAQRLTMEGRDDEALAVSHDAVQMYRDLAVRSRVANLPGLADTLSDHAALLLRTGRQAEAVAAGAEAVQLYRGLASRDRAARLPGLAQALSAYAGALPQGQQDEQIRAYAEAVLAWRELADVNRDAYLPGLAWALFNHAALLGEMARPDEAIPVSAEAVQLYGELARLDRDAHLPGLAMAVANHAEFLARAGQYDLALPLSRQAVELFGELAGRDQATYRPKLAEAVQAHALRLAGAGRREEAIATCRTAVELRHELDRAAYLADYVDSVAFYGHLLVEDGQARRAITPLIAALTLTMQEIPRTHPKNRLAHIVGALQRAYAIEPAQVRAKFREHTGADVPDWITQPGT
jgi:hypothetical protein